MKDVIKTEESKQEADSNSVIDPEPAQIKT